jgi:hypothetical protein
VPSEICQETSERKAASSSDPFLNGVTKAVKEPRKLVLAAMELLRTQIAGLLFLLKDQYIPGLTGQRKAGIPRRSGFPLPAAVRRDVKFASPTATFTSSA